MFAYTVFDQWLWTLDYLVKNLTDEDKIVYGDIKRYNTAFGKSFL